ncbi:FAD-binding and (Fe-S)-binding domain-containing protein [Adhaeretor mobilis]|uniref:Anaerobic glycerol-3-phosphate dehydrogenase subunit C n=1 Tax=Adhaeretor mobilis TaxID=1930276 RepID=A0A517MYF3_9BACT|nr:FAD-binding and (Fe-S)-binding domain-containing protein [Adhaeretor mobilis]QDS99918.1 Anaerobic glycerol-3-phosphate dehydrogenase subunit C [Adhaeretor mobilis]
MQTTTLTEEIKEALIGGIRGGVSFDPVIRGIHATDASHYQINPACVVTPLDEADVSAALELATRFRMPITPRGGATALSGQTFGPGMVLDLSRHFTKILEINPEEGWARVQAGVVRDQLNRELAKHSMQFAPDPATSSRATVGGMIGNNSAGTRSIVHGKTIDHTLETRVALASGEILDFTAGSPESWQHTAEGRLAELQRGVSTIVAENCDEILERYPNVMRRVAGYNLDEFVDDAGYTGPIGPRDNAGTRPWNLSNLVVGSEGTLATILEAKVRIVPLPAATAMCLMHFEDEIAALEAVPGILEHKPSTVELLDGKMLIEAKINASTKHIAGWIEGAPNAVLIVEFSDQPQAAGPRALTFAKWAIENNYGYSCPVVIEPLAQTAVWDTRRLGLGLISNVKGPVKGQAFVEDACLPVEVLAEYIAKMQQVCKDRGVDSSMYAHASVGVIHFRPVLDLHREEHRRYMHEIAEESFNLVVGYGGAFAGEHGDGQVRGEFVPKFYGEKIYEAFRQVKGLFDPDNLMNPGKVIDAPSMIDPETLRYGTNYQEAEIPASFRYADQGGFRLAVEQCNGVGACRKIDAGTMCPSYMATRDEKDSTRGRANALRLAMSGQLGADATSALASDGVHDVLSLCLSCKACKSECPNAVDMSRMKADALQMRYDQRGVPRAARLFGGFPDQVRLAGRLGRVAALFTKLPGARWLINKLVGVDPRRPLPAPAAENLQSLLKKRSLSTSAAKPTRGRVVLFDDTFANYLEPSIGLAAVNLLEGLGYEVILAQAGCCQRPRISVGLVREAKEHGTKTLTNLDKFAREGLPILCLEPSCASSLAGDLPDLIDDAELGKRVAGQIQLLETFLLDEGIDLSCDADEILLHGHCHQKAIFGTQAIHSLFARVDGTNLEEVDSGCCGMAGSFGYTHYELSEQIGEDRLFPAVREAKAAGKQILASGTSCRQQLSDFLGVEAKHWVEVVQPETQATKDHSQDPVLEKL